MVYGSGGGIRQRWWDMAAVVVYGNNDEDGAAWRDKLGQNSKL